MTSTGRVDSRDHIFISYRRDDARGASGRLYDWLRIGFGWDHVFRDVHSIGVGKWRDKIDQALARSAVCVAVIGLRWANAENLRRLHEDSDMVRHELLNALADDAVILVPTLVEGADVPKTGELPAELRSLFDSWNARRVTEGGWEDDIRRLISEIEEATAWPVSPDLDTLLGNAGAAQSRMAELEQERDLQAGQIDALQRTIGDLTTKLAEASASDRCELAAAFAALAKGDTLAAEAAFEREFEGRRLAREQETCIMAEAARNVANLALVHDVRKAVSFYRKALALVPEDPESSRLLGDALITLGDLGGAEAAMRESLDAAATQGDTWVEMASQRGLGDVARLKGNLGDAKESIEAALAIAKRLAESDRSNTAWQCALYISYKELGDVAVAQGQLDDAVQAYGDGLAIIKRLAESDPSNTRWQGDLSIFYENLGVVAMHRGKLDDTLRAYGDGMAIRQQLAESDPSNAMWQGNLSASYDGLGDVAVAQGQLDDAVQAYGDGLAIIKRLAESDPNNTRWQRALSIFYIKLGDVAVAQGQLANVARNYGDGMAIALQLAESDPSNTEWQGDLWLFYSKFGDVAVDQGQLDEAVQICGDGLAIAQRLAESDPSNAMWQGNLSASYDGLGDVAVAQGQLDDAVRAYGDGLAIRQRLAKSDPGNNVWQRILSVSYEKLGDVAVAQGQLDDAVRAYGDGLAIRQRLAESDPGNTEWQRGLWVSYQRLAYLAEQRKKPDEARAYWESAFGVLSDIKQRGLRLSPEDEQFLEALRQRVGKAG